MIADLQFCVGQESRRALQTIGRIKPLNSLKDKPHESIALTPDTTHDLASVNLNLALNMNTELCCMARMMCGFRRRNKQF